MSLMGKVHNQIDFILAPQRFKSCTNKANTRSFPVADIGSDRVEAEELLAEEQEGFRPGRSTVEQIFNGRVIIEKHLQHQRYVFHNSLT